jgi:hypothetical protein
MQTFPLLLLVSILILGYVAWSEYKNPKGVNEGFENLSALSYWASFVQPRGDVGQYLEDELYVRDPRYFNGYADVSRMGIAYDFCRMIAPVGASPEETFFACALAGTNTLGSARFRTRSVKQGFKLGNDDYMRDIDGVGRDAYCRILKDGDSWAPMCNRATDLGFDPKNVVDDEPPDETRSLLSFHQGAVVWLRFKDDMKDYVKSVSVLTSNMTIDETPGKDVTGGLVFNGDNNFLRLSDSGDKSLGAIVPLRAVRTVMVWVKFDAFTQNAKIFDFGNGKGKDNFFLGILGKGDPTVSTGDTIRGDCGADTVPSGTSGAQPVDEMSPQRLMETTSANVDEWRCDGFEVSPRKMPKSVPVAPENNSGGEMATLIYEVWDKEQRRMRMKINSIVPVGKWVHLCVTTTTDDAFRPGIGIYVNGALTLMKADGFLPATSNMTNCYLGKSNWANAVTQYEDRDELFKGRMFDFRMYKTKVSEKFIQESVEWGKAKLGIAAAGKKKSGNTKASSPSKKKSGNTKASSPSKKKSGNTKASSPSKKKSGNTKASSPSKKKSGAEGKGSP